MICTHNDDRHFTHGEASKEQIYRVSKEQIYADDLSIMFLRRSRALRMVMRILQLYHEWCGLAINMTKTACVHIGARLNDPKLCPEMDLEWPDSFPLLGITFTKDIDELYNNFEKPLEKMEKEIELWKARVQTPAGRINIFKSMLLSKFTHLSISLTAKPQLITKLTEAANYFIWGVHQNKIAYKRMILPPEQGGMGAVNIEQFFRLLKVSWFVKATESTDVWVAVLESILAENGINSVEEVFTVGDEKLRNVERKTKHPFWKEALNTLADVKVAYHKSHRDRAIQTSPFDTALLMKPVDRRNRKEPFKKAEFGEMADFVDTCKDLIGQRGLRTYEELQDNGITVNFLTWRSFQEAYNENINSIKDKGLKNKYKSFREFMEKNKGTSVFRKLLQKTMTPPTESQTFKEKWVQKLGVEIHEDSWPRIFRFYDKLKLYPTAKYLNFRILNRFVGVGHLVAKIFQGTTNLCIFCRLANRADADETIEHLFSECSDV